MLEIIGAGIGAERIPSLAPFSAALSGDRPSFVAAEGERGPMLASLIAAGRLVPDRGEVLLDGRTDPEALRRAVVLVDTPVVAEPAPSLAVRTVVQEELRFAARPSRRRDAEALLTSLGLERWSCAPMLDLPPTDRVRLLLELAAFRDGVRALVLTSPERHGGHASGWRRVAEEFTARGLPVLVIGGAAVPESLPAASAAAPTGSLR
ncbi:MAG: hypothetical protein HIU86_04045 [Acidobacteria bacterium]|nr:hypothetical protein [Acidobacteriota bacterium]